MNDANLGDVPLPDLPRTSISASAAMVVERAVLALAKCPSSALLAARVMPFAM
jgi:hypothetical protein